MVEIIANRLEPSIFVMQPRLLLLSSRMGLNLSPGYLLLHRGKTFEVSNLHLFDSESNNVVGLFHPCSSSLEIVAALLLLSGIQLDLQLRLLHSHLANEILKLLAAFD